MSVQVPVFNDIPEAQLMPPEKHPAYKYVGFHPGKTVKLPRGHVLKEGHFAFPCDAALEMDCAVPMRDGVTIYTNVYRPDGAQAPKYPALIAWSPYGKGAGGAGSITYDKMGPYNMGIDNKDLSGYETFEGPNPADWVNRGYCVVDPDARGVMHSEGKMTFWGPQEALDVYDLIEWCIKQDWCDGTAVMFGNSWLATSQVNHAALCPHPALKAIAPWEGVTDLYTDVVVRGGVMNKDAFGPGIMKGLAGLGKAESMFEAAPLRPLFDDYWETKRVDTTKIKLPAYITGSYSTRLHSNSSFQTFHNMPPETTWFRVHASHEWPDLYKKKNMDDLQKFYDHFAKGQDNGWEKTPRIRLSLLNMSDSSTPLIEERVEDATTFPLPQVKNQKLYLDSESMTLSKTAPTTSATASYEAHSISGQLSYSLKFDSYTELSGLPWARLFVSCKEHNDMDVHVIIRKTGVNGNLLSSNNYPIPVSVDELPDLNTCKYQGPNGMLRASHMASQVPKEHPDAYPKFTHRNAKSVEPGSVVAIEIPIWPLGMVFAKGEGIQLIIAGHDLKLPEVPPPPQSKGKILDDNQGNHNVHTGPEQASFIMLPVLKEG